MAELEREIRKWEVENRNKSSRSLRWLILCFVRPHLTMAICKTCGKKYSKWTVPVSARGVCTDCFELELTSEREVMLQQDVSTLETAPMKRPKVRRHLRSFIPRSRSKAVFVLAMACYSWTTASIVGTILRAFRVAPPPIGLFANEHGEPTAHVVDLIFLAPLVESLVLLGLIELFRRLHLPAWLQVLLPAFLIGIFHSSGWWPRGLIVVPGFAIEACAYLYWRSVSRKVAYGVVAAIHAVHNSIPALSVIAYAALHP